MSRRSAALLVGLQVVAGTVATVAFVALAAALRALPMKHYAP